MSSEDHKPKSPPVNIEENKKDQREKNHKKEPLRIVGDPGGDPPRGGTRPRGKVNYTQLILSVGLAVLLVFIIAQFTLATKSEALTLLDNQRLLESNQAETAGKLATETERIENIIAAQANYATKTELSAVESQIQGFATQSALDSLIGIVTGQGSSIESLQDRVEALEASNNGTTSIVGGGFNYYMMGNYLYVKVEESGFYRFKFTLIDEDVQEYGFGYDLFFLEYYTRSYLLEGGEWIHKTLNGLRNALDDEGWGELEDYDVVVELLVGSVESSGEETDDW